ncbi:hypothetical protein [Silvibacterium dinghuense]|uniref:Response regulatory domain-containing protein n=1 Tax=Silvibacterium dinghuense TaxID=1560006 RepID=A0A4Q1SA67_9BACT|nr:hypothetical protein [Silvibacterium dinghuense]RXS93829.1 hypothetical protein ESZ00_17470 [Silvibacterium dinghuense]GGH08040.1 hypothetical protein GCM10011586_25410 [Silvibacterium dinghuense]
MLETSESPALRGAISGAILLAGENLHTMEPICAHLGAQGLVVDCVQGFAASIEHWQEHRHAVVLLDVPSATAVESAVATAVAIKRRDPRQFVGYLADAALHTSGLAGDGIFPRNARQLPGLLAASL